MLTLVVIGLVAGAVTAVSPCVLPVLPMVFFGSGPGHRAGSGRGSAEATAVNRFRPALIVAGLVLGFAVVTLAGSVLLSAVTLPPELLRWAGLAVVFVVGLGMAVPAVERLLQRPFTVLPRADAAGARGPFVLGVALGTLYVPCAGPVIAAIAIAGTSGQVNGGVLILTAAFALGTAVPLMLFAYAGDLIGRRSQGFRRGARRFRTAGGVLIMALAVALTLNLTDGLQRLIPAYTQTAVAAVEDGPAARDALQALAPPSGGALIPPLAQVVPAAGPVVQCVAGSEALANCGPAPAVVGIDTWINTDGGSPVDLATLRGKVVLVDFWTFACINCQHALPFVTGWADTYRDAGLVVLGIHTPEFSFERDPDNVRDAVATNGIHYPVGLDNAAATWRNYHNSYWPAAYLVDGSGTLRYQTFGEGNYDRTEEFIRQLLVAANPAVVLPPPAPSK